MSGTNVAGFLAYWQEEGDSYVRHGDYDWMAAQVPGERVLEIGCGPGFSTVALAMRGLAVLTLEALSECLAVTAARLDAAGLAAIRLQGDVTALAGEERAVIEAFAPDAVVCWLMGAPGGTTGAVAGDGGQAVAAYRETVHRQVAELAAALPTVRALHLVDRTAIPWQAKDIGRDTLVRYHLGRTLAGLPFAAARRQALYRKLEGSALELARSRRSHPLLKGVVPVLAALLAERK